jgi:predicted aldo/keto reductase-like oxidoreductase
LENRHDRPRGSEARGRDFEQEVTCVQYRPVGNTGIQVSALGIGTMRFKSQENAAEMIHRELELGLTYSDIGSAYSYKAFEDNAETWVGAAIKGRDRSKMVLSAKAQPRKGEPNVDRGLGINSKDQMRQCIENSLQRVGVQRFDFYQLWDMSAEEHFEAACVGDDSPLAAMRAARDEGLVAHLGFTTHATADDTISYLERVPDFRFVTIYYNFNDRYSEKVLDYAQEHGIGVAIMGPLRGGLLAGESPVFAQLLPELKGMPVQEIALRFLLDTPAISTVLSGMNEIAHLEQNAGVCSDGASISPEQRERFFAAFQEFTGGEPLCTACRYCAGSCPEGLPVMNLMTTYQMSQVFKLEAGLKQLEGLKGNEGSDPSKCTACETCVEKCPQKLPIPDRMEKLAGLLQ